MNSPIMPTYQRLPVCFERGEGAWLWDQAGNRYLDALSGIAVCNLGHAHPAIQRAVSEQSAKLVHTSNIYQIAVQQRLAERLMALSGMDNVFFCNSGAEANEAAIKLARKYGHSRGMALPHIIVMEKSFHGRTLATLSATGNTKIQQGFEPLVEGFIRVAYNNIEAIEQVLAQHKDIAAILVEPVQGEGGVNIPDSDYLNNIRALCDKHQILMMLDEIQTGVARTGEFLCYQHHGILPDVCTMAKALGNGVPIGACLARAEAANVLSAGAHGSTFGGNPLACSAALAVLEVIEQQNLAAAATQQGLKIYQGLTQRLTSNPHVVDIRHKGLMIGVELAQPCADLVKQALANYLLINVTNDKTIRLLPPLIINDEQIELLVNGLSTLITAFTESL